MRAIIKYFNTKEKYGYISVTGKKDVYFRVLEGDELLKTPCREVTFDLVDNGKNRYATNIAIVPETAAGENTARENTAKEVERETCEKGSFLDDIKETCQEASKIISECTGEEETLYPFQDLSKLYLKFEEIPENTWLTGRPDFYWKHGDRLIQGKIRKQRRYRGTHYGSPIEDMNDPEADLTLTAPKYGCSSFLLGKGLYETSLAYCEKAGINPEFYYFVFVEGEKLVSMISLAHAGNLIRDGYNQFKKLGEYPSKREGMLPRYMLPVTHCEGYQLKKNKSDEE